MRMKPLLTPSDILPPIQNQDAAVEALDQIAREMERKWGIGRLQLVVDPELRERFDRQRAKFDQALAADDKPQVRLHTESLRRGWIALDEHATKAGRPILSPEVWEIKLSTGEAIGLTRTSVDAYAAAHPGREIWSLEEIALLIEDFNKHSKGQVRETKQHFPYARVKAIRNKKDSNFDWERGDDIPF